MYCKVVAVEERCFVANTVDSRKRQRHMSCSMVAIESPYSVQKPELTASDPHVGETPPSGTNSSPAALRRKYFQASVCGASGQ